MGFPFRSPLGVLGLGEVIAPVDPNTLWSGSQADKLYFQSGVVTSTLKTSQDVSAIVGQPAGISFDGTDVPWSGWFDKKLYLTSGVFSSTLKTSHAYSYAETLWGNSWDGTDTVAIGSNSDGDNKLWTTTGEFSSTITDSLTLTAASVFGVTWDGTNTPWCGGRPGSELILQSGQFTSTIKDSLSVASVDTLVRAISWKPSTGDTPWVGTQANKIYIQSGQFTSTLKTSVSVGGIDTDPLGVENAAFR